MKSETAKTSVWDIIFWLIFLLIVGLGIYILIRSFI